MSTDKSKIAARIKALLAMTEANGCTEAEAMSAVAKAAELMAEYQISMTEAELTAEGFENAFIPWESRKRTFARDYLGVHIATYTDTKYWRTRVGDGEYSKQFGVRYYGLRSDVEFATWLDASLANFVIMAADRYVMQKAAGCFMDRKRKEDAWRSFAAGCCAKIIERLKAEKKQTVVKAEPGTSTALVVIDKRRIVEQAFQANIGIKLRSTSARQRIGDGGAYHAGHTAGSSASFGRPVNSSATLRIGRA